MSTVGLVILASIVALAGVAALGFLRWREQQRLEQARKAVALTDDMFQQANVLSVLGPHLSEAARHLAAHHIVDCHQQLTALAIKPNQAIKRSLVLAHEILESQPSTKRPALPTETKTAQQFSEQTRHLLTLVRKAYRQQKLDQSSATTIAREARILNLRVCFGVYESKARAALQMNSPSRAVRFVDKASALMKNNRDDVPALQQALQQLQQDLKTAQLQHAPEAGPSRLEAGAQELEEEEDAWKKKHF
ncbi:hypothetical protein GCM10011297_05650 [Bacterioplanes sanyensis]|uniref:hypothetical protein n=1 Tax=Bacterioplanes sanyensis TaxID=1249553 RepID=UPI001676DFA9|nr:hypothetical protein [Bacterioplanes sanyensis]GGY35398.1 hypothetical protein GCM10011297_05650 [Bacterioplanes sanyensis]